MIKSITIDNFKNIRHAKIDFEPLTVLVGANASGKTSVLEAVQLAVRSALGKPENVFDGDCHCDWLYTRGATSTLSLAFTANRSKFYVKASPPDGFSPSSNVLGTGSWEFEVRVPGGAIAEARHRAATTAFLRLNTSKLAAASYSDNDPPRVEPDGEGLASVLAYMALNDPDAFQESVSHMQALIPNLKRIRFKKEPVTRLETELVRFGEESIERKTSRKYQGDAILFDFTNGDNISVHTASEGTLMLLGLLAVLFGPTRPQLLLMDNIEQGLHPLAQKSLLDVISKVMQKFPDLQIIATAHSPYLLDYLRPEQIRLMALGQDGYAVCGRLENHPQFNKWKDEMAPGELWSLFGEKWLAGESVAT